MSKEESQEKRKKWSFKKKSRDSRKEESAGSGRSESVTSSEAVGTQGECGVLVEEEWRRGGGNNCIVQFSHDCHITVFPQRS